MKGRQETTNELKDRFLTALRNEDALLALRAYQCTQADFYQWRKEEEEEEREEMRKKQELAQQQKKGKRSRNVVSIPRNQGNVTVNDSIFDVKQFNQVLSSLSYRTCPPSAKKGVTEEEKQEIQSISLELELGLVESSIHPSKLISLYDSNIEDAENMDVRESAKLQKLPNTILGRGPSLDNTLTDSERGIREDQNDNIRNPSLTTTFHEAARLGNLQFIQYLISKGGDVNMRDGMRRTTLHMICGGFTKIEHALDTKSRCTRVAQDDDEGQEEEEKDGIVGIPLYVPPVTEEGNQHKKRKGFLARFIDCCTGKKNSEARALSNSAQTPSVISLRDKDVSKLIEMFADIRMASLRAILSNSKKSPAINSVDCRGRTALHYAAELGRVEMCKMFLESDQMNLTIIDENNRTPCELAGIHGHTELAAELEARALIGSADDMSILAGWSLLQEEERVVRGGMIENTRDVLKEPFSWFETVESVDSIRVSMIEEAMEHLGVAIGEIVAKLDLNIPHGRIENVCDESNPLNTSTNKCESDEQSFMLKFLQLTKNQVTQLLSYHDWILRNTLESFRANPLQTLTDAGVVPIDADARATIDGDNMCLICYDEFSSESSEWVELKNCSHYFCLSCLSDYLRSCAASRNTSLFSIPCPHHECSICLDEDDIRKVTNNENYEALLQIENDNFVSSAKDFSFCPSPGCECVVHRLTPSYLVNQFDEDCLEYVSAVCTTCPVSKDSTVRTYEGVLDSKNNSWSELPKSAHRFCFVCKSAAHWPISCDMLEKWKDKVMEEVGEGDDSTYEDVAQKLWMKANTMPCPKCQVPIEKNDGCNHMTCSNRTCKHEFCWICRKDWKLHNTKTGGYFRCNRWQEDGDTEGKDGADLPPPPTADAPLRISDASRYGTAIHSAVAARKKNRLMARFLHHYTRWSAHKESAFLERKMKDSVCDRLTLVVEAVMEKDISGLGNNGLSFIHAAFIELLECRSVLEHTYPFAFYRYSMVSAVTYRIKTHREIEKLNFERLQSELEMLTEQMSDIVARKHLRATMTQIMFLTSAAADKRTELSMFMISLGHEERRRAKNKEKMRIDGTLSRSRLTDDERNDHVELSDSQVLDYLARATAGPGNNNRVEEAFNFQMPPEEVPEQNDFATLMGQNHGDDDEEEAAFQLALQASVRQQEAFTAEAMELQEEEEEEIDDDDSAHEWACPVCTFINRAGKRCSMCGGHR